MTTPVEYMTQHELIKAAHRNLDRNVWDYLVGGSESETTLRRNRLALDSLAFRPRVLRDISKIDTSVQVLGATLRLPIMLAPIGSLESFEDGGGATATRAARAYGVAHMLSSVCDPGLEAVADAAPDGVRIFQLYVRDSAEWVDDHVRRAVDRGYKAFCLTVDTAIYSRRERDISKRYLPHARRGARGHEFQRALDWRTVERIKSKFDVPLVLKGIATSEDAETACQHGVDVVYVSNHGGRQLDHGRGGVEVMPEVVQAVGGRAKIWYDGGVMRGTDVIKAVALGAELVGIGRLEGIAMAAAGEAGVVRMLELLEHEIISGLGLLGVTRFGELDSSYLHPATPTALPHVFSAFPLLDLYNRGY